MNFVARIDYPEGSPLVRAYLHRAGIECFGSETDLAKTSRSAAEYLGDVLRKFSGSFRDMDFILAALWGEKFDGQAVRVADVFGYRLDRANGWAGNPEMYAFVFKNERYTPPGLDVPTTCGEVLRVLGREEEYRVTTPNLQRYRSSYRELPGLDRIPSISF